MSLRRLLSAILALAVAVCAPLRLSAQELEVPQVEVFGGYSWYRAGGNLNHVSVPDFTKGWAGQFTYNLNRWAGLAVDVGGHYNDIGHAHGVAFGPQFRLQRGRFVPFGEIVLGIQDFAPKQYPSQNAASFIMGGGVDVRISSGFSIRPVQVDFVDSYYTAILPRGQTNQFNGVRLQSGVVFNLGSLLREDQVSASCSAAPAEVDEGTPVEVEVVANGFLPSRTLTYSYSTTGGVVVNHQKTATVVTKNLAPGEYTVRALVVDNGKGTRHQQAAGCKVVFTIKAMHPPSLSLSADPSSLQSGESSMIMAGGSSADNRRLSYNCSDSGGWLSGDGPVYTLETAGLPDGQVTVNCTVSDNRKLTASAQTTVDVHVPVAATRQEEKATSRPEQVMAFPPEPSRFGAIEFKHDTKRPARVDNEAKGELDRYADALALATDAKAVVVALVVTAETGKDSKEGGRFAAMRAVNTKRYLTEEKGMDGARIEPRTCRGDEQTAELWLVPAGAGFMAAGSRLVNEAGAHAASRHRRQRHEGQKTDTIHQGTVKGN